MENVKMEVKGNKLTIEIDLSVTGSPSATGKTLVLASTRGNKSVPEHEGVFIGVNCYKKR